MQQAKKILEEVGIEPERVEMFNLGASEGARFAKAVDEMAERARRLGPDPFTKHRGEVG